ncbi:ParB/RepB/Spo0J family partition protein [Anaerotignum sp.]|nr:ParB/RepB/Spo0J family partition protein [Anaerotignum sp.]MBQ7759318.1 ParB/RepB/Spo0J family partition protein [Anaerotignum sp.]
MKQRIGEKIKLTSYSELLGISDEQNSINLEISQIKSFKNHPFKVQMDRKMEDLIESIKENGIITPVLVRPLDDGYEMVSGHRRMFAAKSCGLQTIPAIIREMDDDEAIVAMVDANIQREELLPSEKAFAYKMKLEAIKRQGFRADLTSDQNGRKSESAYTIAEEVGESKTQIRRYIRLTELIPDLLSLVDTKKLLFTVGVEISYLDKEMQGWIEEYIRECGTINLLQICSLRKVLENRSITQEELIQFLNTKRNGLLRGRKITLRAEQLEPFFPVGYTGKQMEEVILMLLKNWSNDKKEG